MTNPDNVGGLLPCPFCGGESERIDFGVGSGDNEGGSCIACKKCQASGPVEFGYKENFVSNWNRRKLYSASSGDAGGLPELPPSYGDHCVTDSVRTMREPGYTADQMRAYGELCRAAPAGGDGCTESNCERCSTAPHARGDMRHAGIGTYPSAPAGSGEVEKQARALYVRWVDQQDMHCNRFPSWQELSAKDRQEWFDKVVAADTGNAAVDRVIGRLMSSDPDFDDCAEAAALLRKLQQGAE